MVTARKYVGPKTTDAKRMTVYDEIPPKPISVNATGNFSLTSSELLIDSITANLVSIWRNKFSFTSRYSLNTSGVVTLRMRYATGASVTTSGTQFFETIVPGTGGNSSVSFFKTLPSPSTAQYTIGVFALAGGGATSGVFNGAAGGAEREFLMECIGLV